MGQLIRRPVFEYDEAAGPAAYRGKQWEKPAGPVLKMSLEEAGTHKPRIVVLGQGNKIAKIKSTPGAD